MGLGQLLTAASYAIIARSAGPAEFGPAAALAAASVATAGLLDWGSYPYMLREYSEGRVDGNRFGAWNNGRLLRFLPGSLVLVGAACLIGEPDVVLLAGSGLLVLVAGMTLPAGIPWRASGQMHKVGLAVVAGRLLALAVATISAFALGDKAATVLPWVTASGLAVEYVIQRRGWPREARATLRVDRQTFRGTLRLGTSSAIIGLQGFDTALVVAAAGAVAGGTYAAVNRWLASINLAIGGFSQAAFPRIAAQRSRAQALGVLRAGVPFAAVALAGIMLIVLLADDLVLLILGPEYRDSGAVLRILAISMIPALINQPVYWWLQARRHESAALVAIALAIPVQMGAIYLLALRGGAVGASTGWLIGQLAASALLVGGLISTRAGK